MQKLSILMTREAFDAWAKSHKLGDVVHVTIEETEYAGTIVEFGTYKNQIEVRMHLKAKI